MSSIKVPETLIVGLVTAACIGLVYGRILAGEFVVDDRLWATQAAPALTLQDIWNAFFQWGFSDTALNAGHTPFYRPLGAVIFKCLHAWFGPDASAWHTLSLVIHAFNAVLFHLLLRRLLPDTSATIRLLATLIFALHPAGAEAVLWISSMGELLVTSTMLLTIWLLLRWFANLTTPRILVLALLVLAGCLIKETALASAVLVISLPSLVAWLPIPKRAESINLLPARPIAWPLVLGMVAVSLLYLIWRTQVIGSLAADQTLAPNIGRVVDMALTHLRFLTIPAAPPFALAAPEIELAGMVGKSAALLLVIAATVAAITVRAPMALWLFAGLWVAVTLWPAYAIALVGDGFFAGRHAYPATAGIALGVGLLLAGWQTRCLASRHSSCPRHLDKAVLAAIMVWVGLQALHANETVNTWQDNIRVYQQAAKVSPNADGPWAGQAQVLADRGDMPAALSHYREALARAKTDGNRADYLFQMASLLGQAGQTSESSRLLGDMLAIRPRDSTAWTGLGNNAWLEGRFGEAETHYLRAIEYDPDNAEARQNLANLRRQIGAGR